MDDILIACITDILAYLESGLSINPTSCMHDQLRANSRTLISDYDIAENECMKGIIDDGGYNLDGASDLFKKILSEVENGAAM